MSKVIRLDESELSFVDLFNSWKEAFAEHNNCYTELLSMKSAKFSQKQYLRFLGKMEDDFRRSLDTVLETANLLRSYIDEKCSETDCTAIVTRFAYDCANCERLSIALLLEMSKFGVSELSDHIGKMKNEELALLWVEASRQQERITMTLTGMLHPVADVKEFGKMIDAAMLKFNKYIRKCDSFAAEIRPLLRDNISEDELLDLVRVLSTACRSKNCAWEVLYVRNKNLYYETIQRTDARNGGTMSLDDLEDIMSEFATCLPQYLSNYRYGTAKYSTFITPYLYQPYRRVKRNVLTTGLSTYEENQLHSVNKAITELLAQGREITVENVARYLHIGVRAASTALAIKERVNTVSLDDEDSDGHHMQVADPYSLQELLEKQDTVDTVKKRVLKALRSISAPGLVTLSYQSAIGLIVGDVSVRAVAKKTGHPSAEIRRVLEALRDKLRWDESLREIYSSDNLNPQLKAIEELEKEIARTSFELCLPKKSVDDYMDDISNIFLQPGETLELASGDDFFH